MEDCTFWKTSVLSALQHCVTNMCLNHSVMASPSRKFLGIVMDRETILINVLGFFDF